MVINSYNNTIQYAHGIIKVHKIITYKMWILIRSMVKVKKIKVKKIKVKNIYWLNSIVNYT